MHRFDKLPIMVKTTVYLEPETAVFLRELARHEDRSQADLIREALRIYSRLRARRRERPKPVGIGRFRSGRSDVSARAEELLREAAKARR